MATSRNVDFSSVKDGGNFNKRRIPAGDYLATITKIEDAEAKDGIFQYLVSLKIDSRPSSVFPYYCKLQENQLWKLRNLMIAAGLAVPKKKVKVDPNRLVNRKVGVTVEDDEYDGKEQSTIAGVFPAAELADGGQLDSPAEVDDDDLTDDDLADDDLADDEDVAEEEEAEPEMTRAELKAAIKKLNPDFRAKTSQTDDDLRQMLNELQSAGDDDEADEEEEEEEPEPPKPVARKRAPRAAKKASAAVSDEELEELDIDDL